MYAKEPEDKSLLIMNSNGYIAYINCEKCLNLVRGVKNDK